ncbi:MAG TPA: nucleotidyl transferase AbiEii/AbiGii toxin family protein [Solirubrobacteraceae bacterium]|nr:nucleotidyl transferase AbiEii/AbiGii toxin family protein [Solirubrobacteraceae bacterium]
MRYSDGGAFRQALEQRLKTRAGKDGARLARDRKRVAFDRLLARLATIAPGSWLLKGGFALDLRLAERARATKDVDLDWQAAEAELLETLLEAAAWDAADFFSFIIERIGPPQDRLGGSHRFRVAASLGGRRFETFLLDVGFHSEPIAGIETLMTPNLLSFAGIEPVTVRVVPLELQIAEKLHAYTRTRENKRPSTRTKDLVDLSLIAELSVLDAAMLTQAIDTTFSNRTTDQLPSSLPPPPEEWRTPFRQLAQAVGVADDIKAGHATAAALLNPILSGEIKRGRWNPNAQHWTTEDQTCMM